MVAQLLYKIFLHSERLKFLSQGLITGSKSIWVKYGVFWAHPQLECNPIVSETEFVSWNEQDFLIRKLIDPAKPFVLWRYVLLGTPLFNFFCIQNLVFEERALTMHRAPL